MTHGDRSRTLTPTALGVDTLGVDLFASADIDAGRARMLSVIRQLLELRPAAGFEIPDDDGAVLDPAYFVYFSTPSPPLELADVARRVALRTPLRGTLTSLVAADHSGVWPLLEDWQHVIDWDQTGASEDALRVPLERAFRVLDQVQPRLSVAIRTTTRVVVSFAGEGPNSFAARSAHGAVFLNWRPGDGLPYAIEELAHQGGHVLLTTILFGVEEARFVVPPDSPMPRDLPNATSNLTPDPEDRTVLVMLHAVVTEALMVMALEASLTAPELTPIERHEVRGRLAYILHRFRDDLIDLLSAAVLSELGRELVDNCRAAFEGAVEHWLVSDRPLDLSGQPYAFCRQRFLSANPLPG